MKMSITLLGSKNSFLYPWWKPVIFIDVLLVFETVLQQYIPSISKIPGANYFNLATENNLGVWWSSICLLTFGLLSYELFSTNKDGTRTAWLALSFLFIGLSWDEIGSLHERVGGWSNLMPYALVCIVLCIYSLSKLLAVKSSRKSAYIIIAACILFFSVALQEYLEHALTWPFWLSGIRVGIEEGTELLGILLCLAALVHERKKHLKTNSLLAIIPNPCLMNHFMALLFSGLLVHLGFSLYSLGLSDLSQRGNPAICYPTSLFYVLFAISLWKALNEGQTHPRIWNLAAIEFIFVSAGIVFNPFGIFSNFYFVYGFQIGLIILLAWLTDKEKYRNYVVVFTSLVYILAMSYYTQSPLVESSFPGVFTFLTAVILLNSEEIQIPTLLPRELKV